MSPTKSSKRKKLVEKLSVSQIVIGELSSSKKKTSKKNSFSRVENSSETDCNDFDNTLISISKELQFIKEAKLRDEKVLKAIKDR